MRDIRKILARKHNTRYKLVRSAQFPEAKWHISEWQPGRKVWQYIIGNVSLEEAFTALESVGAITQAPQD